MFDKTYTVYVTGIGYLNYYVSSNNSPIITNPVSKKELTKDQVNNLLKLIKISKIPKILTNDEYWYTVEFTGLGFCCVFNTGVRYSTYEMPLLTEKDVQKIKSFISIKEYKNEINSMYDLIGGKY